MNQNNRESLIRAYFPNSVNTIREKSELITNYHIQLSEFMKRTEWRFLGKEIRITNGERSVADLILNNFKKVIKRNSTLKQIDDNYADEFANTAVFFSSDSKSKNCSISYNVYSKSNLKYDSILLVEKFDLLSEMRDLPLSIEFLKIIISILNPYSIDVTDFQLYTSEERRNNKYWPGWMMYFDASFELPNLPEWVKVETLANGGHLIITTEEIFNPENQEHKEKARILLPFLQLKSSAI